MLKAGNHNIEIKAGTVTDSITVIYTRDRLHVIEIKAASVTDSITAIHSKYVNFYWNRLHHSLKVKSESAIAIYIKGFMGAREGGKGSLAPQLFDYQCLLLLVTVKRNWRNFRNWDSLSLAQKIFQRNKQHSHNYTKFSLYNWHQTTQWLCFSIRIIGKSNRL